MLNRSHNAYRPRRAALAWAAVGALALAPVMVPGGAGAQVGGGLEAPPSADDAPTIGDPSRPAPPSELGGQTPPSPGLDAPATGAPGVEMPDLEEPVGDGALGLEPPAPGDPDARDQARSDDAEYYYGESDWRAYAEGYTLYYSTYADGAVGGLVGREYYVPGGDRVIFVYFDGRCFDGRWSENAGMFCFEYDGTHCFEHIARQGQVFARELDGDLQIVIRRTDEVLSCAPDPVSRSPQDGPGRVLARLTAPLLAPGAAAGEAAGQNEGGATR